MKTEQLIKYFKGDLSEKEKEEVHEWTRESEANKKQFIKLKNTWSLSASNSDIRNSQLEIAWQVLKEKIGEKKAQKTKSISFYFKYAAILIIAFGAGLLGEKYLLSPDKTGENANNLAVIQAPPGQGAQVTLPDSSNVYLNSGTKLSYQTNFLQDKRTINLKGEAFFEVSEDKKHPFVVKTEKLNLFVHGTSFNVEAYEDSEMNVTLVEGSLGLNSKKGNELVRIKPGEKANYDPEKNKIFIEEVDTELYTSWRNGIITFRNVPLWNIVGKIERWYNVEIEIRSKELQNQTYSGTLLKSKPVDQILEALSITASFNYEIEYTDDAPTLIKLHKKKEK